jgi:hypothetical protein
MKCACRLLCLNVSITNIASYRDGNPNHPCGRKTAISPRSISPKLPASPAGRPTLSSQGVNSKLGQLFPQPRHGALARPAPCERTVTLRHPQHQHRNQHLFCPTPTICCSRRLLRYSDTSVQGEPRRQFDRARCRAAWLDRSARRAPRPCNPRPARPSHQKAPASKTPCRCRRNG